MPFVGAYPFLVDDDLVENSLAADFDISTFNFDIRSFNAGAHWKGIGVWRG